MGMAVGLRHRVRVEWDGGGRRAPRRVENRDAVDGDRKTTAVVVGVAVGAGDGDAQVAGAVGGLGDAKGVGTSVDGRGRQPVPVFADVRGEVPRVLLAGAELDPVAPSGGAGFDGAERRRQRDDAGALL